MLENDNHKFYWDRTAITDRIIPCNRPNMTLIDKRRATTCLIDIDVPNSHNAL